MRCGRLLLLRKTNSISGLQSTEIREKLLDVTWAIALVNQLVSYGKVYLESIDNVPLPTPIFGSPSSCRKPKPGLLLQAAEELEIDLSQSFMIGDRWSDIAAGQAAGCKLIFLLTMDMMKINL